MKVFDDSAVNRDNLMALGDSLKFDSDWTKAFHDKLFEDTKAKFFEASCFGLPGELATIYDNGCA